MSDNNEFTFDASHEMTYEELLNDLEAKPNDLWAKAHKAVTAYPKGLKSVSHNGSTYLVTPTVGDKPSFAVAVKKDGAEKSINADLYIWPNANPNKMIWISKVVTGSESELVHSNTGKMVESAPFSAVLDNIVETVQNAKREDDRNRERSMDDVKDFVAGLLEFGVTAGMVLFVIAAVAAVIYGLVYAASGDSRYAEQFDQNHKDLVIDGVRVHTGQEVLLPGSKLPDGIPLRAGDISNITHPRTFLVQTNSCATDDSVVEGGVINGNNILIAQTDAPDNVIRLRVGKDNFVDMCASNPDNRGSNDYVQYEVVLQQIPA